jgi:hypothetical protein
MKNPVLIKKFVGFDCVLLGLHFLNAVVTPLQLFHPFKV